MNHRISFVVSVFLLSLALTACGSDPANPGDDPDAGSSDTGSSGGDATGGDSGGGSDTAITDSGDPDTSTPDTSGPCTPGERTEYECPHGPMVPHCVCGEDGQWQCIRSPENACWGAGPCDDGSVLSCFVEMPLCESGSVPAVIDGCWLCVSEDTCVFGPDPCSSDADCSSAEYCDGCATSSCPECEDCVAGCVPHGCPSEPTAFCNMIRPECGAGEVAIVTEGCWECVDMTTCSSGPGICSSDADCADDEWCPDCPEGVECEAPSCVPNVCPTEDFAECDRIRPECGSTATSVIQGGCWVCLDNETCEPVEEPVPVECSTNSECDNDEWCNPCTCPDGELCAECMSLCEENPCDGDGSELACRMMRPDCEEGFVSAIFDGCWECVEIDSCDVPSEFCESDLDCAIDEICSGCRPSDPLCDGPPAVCAPSPCGDGEFPDCFAARPDCGVGRTAIVEDGCWACVDLDTCEGGCESDFECPVGELCVDGTCEELGCPAVYEPVCGVDGETYSNSCAARVSHVAVAYEGECVPGVACSDGSDVLCDMIPPVCEDGSVLAISSGCFECVNPLTCAPWGEPGCRTDDDCADGYVCDTCATSSCPFCEDCVPACIRPF